MRQMELLTGGPRELEPQSDLFFDRHRERLGELFDVLGVPAETLDSLADTIAVTQPWARREHTDNDDSQLTLAQVARTRELYREFGMVDEVPLPAGDYSQIIINGGMHIGNHRRAGFVAESLRRPDISVGRLVLLSGQRELEPDREKAHIETSLANLAAKPAQDAWTSGVLREPERLKWETDLLRLAAADRVGPLILRQLHLRLAEADPIERYELTSGELPVSLIHSLPVKRQGAMVRPTTGSCVRDWMRIMPPEQGARVGFITTNPHIERMARVAWSELVAMGREDIELVPAGPSSVSNQDGQIYKGEIARNLYEDGRAAGLV